MADQAAHERLNRVLEAAGVSRTVYPLVMKETEAALDDIIDGGSARETIRTSLSALFAAQAQPAALDAEALAARIAAALSDRREPFRDMYRAAWTQKQGDNDRDFFETWRRWASPVVTFDEALFAHTYPTAGATEGLRSAINNYAACARKEGFSPVIHVFDGEYEGFAAAAQAAGIPVRSHSRKDWEAALGCIGPDDQVYLSQPSAIDGNVWGAFDDFARALHDRQPGARILADLTYVGCVARPFHVDVSHPNIQTVFFSLSKPMGAYHHRIGGCVSRQPYPDLFGNKYFNNMLSLKLATEMMRRHGVQELPRKYECAQHAAVADARARLGIDLKPSDVVLLATAAPRENPSDLERYLTRGPEDERLIRLCLTPVMAHMIDPSVSGAVRPRPHEELSPAP